MSSTPLVLGGGALIFALLLVYFLIHYVKRSQRMSDAAEANRKAITLAQEAQTADSVVAADVARERATLNQLLSQDSRLSAPPLKPMP